MIKSNISRSRSNGTYKVSLSGLTKAHLQALTSVLGHLAPLDVEVHHYNGIELPFQHLETFCPLADVNKMCVSTQNKVLRDISKCFTTESDMPEREQLFSFVTFKKYLSMQNKTFKQFLIAILVAICSAIVAFFRLRALLLATIVIAMDVQVSTQ